MRTRRILSAVLVCWVALLAAVAAQTPASSLLELQPPAEQSDAKATVVLCNENDPESVAIGRFYAEQRGIPASNIILVKTSSAEEISREEYDTQIAEPVRRAFTVNFWWKLREPEHPLGPVERTRIRFMAIIRGVPLKIAGVTTPYPGDKPVGPPSVSGVNAASVDSELAVVGLGSRSISGVMNNPYFRSYAKVIETGRPELLLVCRLDGPTPAIVRRMIVDSLAAEKTGLNGFAYVDARGLKDDPGYGQGDDWLLGIARDARKRGTPVILDNGSGMFPDAYPMRDTALYFGWYSENVSGPFARTGFRFVPGAVACHIHSFSASTVRDAQRHWVGPLLAAGAAATMGNVYEPYLALTPHLDVFHDRLRAGFTFAESAYMAQRVLSWMTTFVGDPLYRPYPQLLEGRKAGKEDVWGAYQAGAKVWQERGRAAGEQALKLSARRLRSGMIHEGLGLLQLTANDRRAAVESFAQARKFYLKEEDTLRAAIHEAIALMALDREDDARALAKAQAAAHPNAPALAVLGMIVPEAASAVKKAGP